MFKLIAPLFVAAGLIAAQNEDDLPSCAQTCLNDFITGSQIADCNRLDVACICANEDFINGIGCCILEICEEKDQTFAIQYAATLCGGEGVTVPTEISCTTTTSAGASEATTATTTGGDAPAETTATSDSETAATDDSTTSPNAGATAGAAAMGGVVAGVLAVAAML